MKLTELNHTKAQRPLLIAGPCSAENRDQVLKVAEGLNKEITDYFRAGIWKPRTRPGSFEGIGSEGLEWLKEVKANYGLPICTEVANVKHVYEALRSGVDMVWIGARTSTNPFAVQEIADALEGVDIEVLVKNPINPDVNLWRGAIERLQLKGITKIGAIHRGFSKYGQNKYRNETQWQIPIELKRTHPEIPLICDPSHISGKREYISKISQKALDLNFDGLMIESHCNPDEAWSDAAQQLTPQSLNDLMNQLSMSKVSPSSNSQESLSELRSEIDEFDTQLLEILKQRMIKVEKIGQYKKANQMTILQNDRWSEILDKNAQLAQEHNLDSNLVDQILKAIHQGSINLQEKIIRESE